MSVSAAVPYFAKNANLIERSRARSHFFLVMCGQSAAGILSFPRGPLPPLSSIVPTFSPHRKLEEAIHQGGGRVLTTKVSVRPSVRPSFRPSAFLVHPTQAGESCQSLSLYLRLSVDLFKPTSTKKKRKNRRRRGKSDSDIRVRPSKVQFFNV